MFTILMTIHVAVSLFLILIVLVQSGRSGGFSGLMGGGGGDSLFSTASQQSGLRKATVVMAVIFMFTSLGLTVLSSRESEHTVFQTPVPTVPSLPQKAAPVPHSEP